MKFKKVVAAIIFFNKKILAAQRKHSENIEISLKYEFPGGKIKKYEKKTLALKRELREELNININYLDFYFYNTFKYSDIEVKLYFYLCKLESLNIKLNVHESYKFLAVKELRKVQWLAADYPVIKKLEKDFKDL